MCKKIWMMSSVNNYLKGNLIEYNILFSPLNLFSLTFHPYYCYGRCCYCYSILDVFWVQENSGHDYTRQS